MKKCLALALAVLMLFAMLPVQALAETAIQEQAAAGSQSTTADSCVNGHTVVVDLAVNPTCTSTGLTEGTHCSVCNTVLIAQTVVDKLPHSIVYNDGKQPTYIESGWEPFETCNNCDYSTFVSLPALGEAHIDSYEEFVMHLQFLEILAGEYVKVNPGKDPVALVIKYIRTGVDRYNTGSWGIMAGYEDAAFAKFVRDTEDQINAELDISEKVKITGLKNINNFELPNGDYADIGHVFGSMDITYHNKSSINHADVSGWTGDLVDLLELCDIKGVSGTLDEMIAEIGKNYLGKQYSDIPGFGQTDIYGDLDAFRLMQALYGTEYEVGALSQIFAEYFTDTLTDEERAEYFLKNRLETTGTRVHIRNAVYNAYIGNSLASTLEGTREFTSSDISDLRKAVCYAFADYLCKLAGDYVEEGENAYYEVFESSASKLAPGITQESYRATSADGKQMAYFLATADLSREDVNVYANYNNNDPTTWEMARVLDQANAAQKKYGDPESEHYIPNYNVVVSTNADGYNMTTGEPGGLLIMNGTEYHAIDGGGFFGITKDNKAVIGTLDDYNKTYKNQLKEAIGGFGTVLIKDGKIAVSKSEDYYNKRASRTAAGITKTGKVVLMVLDGRQEPYSCGGSMEEIAQIMYEAGCVHAINLDGGGSSTFVAKPEGEDELKVISSPSDGAPRSVSTSLMFVSTAPSSTAFDHAKLESKYAYSTIGTQVQINPIGISATGNEAELPEGYTWTVSDTRWASITQDGIFTGLRPGSVEVNLMLGDAVIGTKTMNIVSPDNIYFSKETIDAVYGATVTLPVIALYEGKQVAINASDIVLSMSNNKAGTLSGFEFTANENSNIKNLKITAALANDTSIYGSISVNLYKQGENSFDFEQATGGDRMLAYDRVITNATTKDNVTYTAVDTNEDMVTSYIFAMDLTQIPIPEQLADLVYMLPGADMEGASAWTFLLQLAERVSVLTEVTPVLRFDADVDVDYSELTIMNEYFSLTSTSFDEATNTLTLKLNWIDQTQAIDPATANPLCIVSGIKLTPKADAKWDANNRLSMVHSGEISYNVFLRASALYSFAQKAENQAIYGLKPFVNPDLPSEAGASFGSIYKEFEDTYNLVNAIKNGWVNEDGGFAYYIQGAKQYGVKLIDGHYYDFGTNGINSGKTTYTGIFRDDENGKYYYAKSGVLATGWQSINGNWHYFDPQTKAAVSGKYKVGTIGYEFTEDGKLVSGVWVTTSKGSRYYYGPDYYRGGGSVTLTTWMQIDGKTYCIDKNGYRYEGPHWIVENISTDCPAEWYEFDENGVLIGKMDMTGLLVLDWGTFYLRNGVSVTGLVNVDGDYYYFNYSSKAAVKDRSYTISNTNGLPLKADTYDFDVDGKLIPKQEVIAENGGLYYYVNGVLKAGAGMIMIGEDYYYVRSSGQLATGKYYCAHTNGVLAEGYYNFDTETGKMVHPKNGVYADESTGKLYYYIDDVVQTSLGMIVIGKDIYYVRTNGEVATGRYFCAHTNGVKPAGYYLFDEATGKLVIKNGVHRDEATGKLYYYIDDVAQTSLGMIEYEGDIYYVRTNGEVATGKYYCAHNNGVKPEGYYVFDKNTGKMVDPRNGVCRDESTGKLYYYIDDVVQTSLGMIEVDGDIYYVRTNGEVATGKYYCAHNNGVKPEGYYVFDKNTGKMVDPRNGVCRDESTGKLYYYIDDVAQISLGMIEVDGDIYYVRTNGEVATGRYYCAHNNGVRAEGYYEFDEVTGKMIG